MKDLFEDLKNIMQCSYISDLRYGKNFNLTILYALHFSFQDYELDQWNDFVEYMFGENKIFNTLDEVYEYLENKFM